ncbi:hypothetical protein J2045_002157 [Peteryoungia aggregata LMG 23059]|uniref:Uncharacterized protein n=1 Tax=Peteryoungia aggregata LMG 23059 TaxID=1368425 RepID=A0ABU0G709_9HYPH|nr:hypothetical protein [Peteryoungia aggregata]MDQ0421130.1 hypothetical protein [Peteryoungia aggregata LMG 23059]
MGSKIFWYQAPSSRKKILMWLSVFRVVFIVAVLASILLGTFGGGGASPAAQLSASAAVGAAAAVLAKLAHLI